jgi:glycosyltransferase involved in cell wall biosynthesis
MSNLELVSEIKNSDLVVFPYIEASQSGTIPICKELGIPVLVTPVGGLPEQVSECLNGTVSTDMSPNSFSKHIEEILTSNSTFLGTAKLVSKSIEKPQLIRNCIDAHEN